MKKILIADDVLTNRLLLSQTLNALGDYIIIEAVNGQEAIDQYDKEKPDLILMDIMMPGVDGHQATTTIKSKMGEDYTPIIFVTALSTENALSTALASGGDDFISKPFNIEVLESKIKAHLRIRELNQQLNVKSKSLMRLNQQLIHEQELVEHFFESAIQQSFLDERLIKYHMSSLSTFNGDLLLVERAPSGGLYLVMGDFSGHGLAAAMGTLPVAMIFFKMVAESSAVGEIAREINNQLHKLMPINMFFVATILELNARGNLISVWMGGMPESYWLDKTGASKGEIHSKHMPLGVLDNDEFDSSIQIFNIECDDKLYLYSDGIVEAKNAEGELFGDKRLRDIVINGGEDRFDRIINELNSFADENNQNDDITLVELTCQKVPPPEKTEENFYNENALAWEISIPLNIDDMRGSDPVRKLSSIICSLPYVSRHVGILHVILSEIYNNALDHSILNFKSIEKTDEDHFAEYYNKRDAALLELDDAAINFDFRFVVNNDCYHLEIMVSDSGTGFQEIKTKSSEDKLYGRGLSIISNFSEKVSYSDDGKLLTIVYKL